MVPPIGSVDARAERHVGVGRQQDHTPLGIGGAEDEHLGAHGADLARRKVHDGDTSTLPTETTGSAEPGSGSLGPSTSAPPAQSTTPPPPAASQPPPEQTAKPTPEPTPAPTTEPTPEPTPDPTVTPEPTPAPTPTPEASPSPAPSVQLAD